MNKIGSIALTTALLLGSVYAQSAIRVVGNQRVDVESIRAYFPGNDPASMQKGAEALKASGMFKDVRVSGSTVSVVENAVLNKVVFEGNKRVKTEVLSPEMSSKSRGPYSQDLIKNDVERIVEIYRRTGYYDVTVTPKTIDLPNGRIDLVFEVTEGKKSTIKKITFVGNSAFSSGRLKDEMSSSEGGLLGFMKTSNIYDADKLNADQESIRRYYMRKGYADFRVISAVADFDKEQNGFFITITVEEGAQYRFGNVDVLSNIGSLDSNLVKSRIHTSAGSVYSVEQVDKSIDALTVEAARRGFAFAQVRPRGEKDTVNKLIHVAYVIEEGPRVYVERIQVRGNTRTRDNVVRREFDLAEGDAFNRALVDRAERRLNNLGFFKNVKVTSEPGSAPDRVILNVDVEDQSTGEFSVGGGYSTTDGVLAEVSVTEKNFMGRGQYVKVGAQLGARVRGVDFSFTEPYFLDKRLSFGFDLFHKEVKRSNYVNYDTKTTGGAIRFGIPITEELSTQLRYSLYAQRINLPPEYDDCVGSYTAACIGNGEGSVAIRELNGKTRIVSMLGYSLIYNSLDRVFQPTTGIYAEFKQDFAGLGGDAKFLKTEAEARFYSPLGGDFVGSLRLSGGNVTATGGNKIKVMDQFFKGPELVRGFATAGMGPRDFAVIMPNLGNQPDALGGTNYVGASTEITFPFGFLPKDFGMRGAVFADAGALWGYNATTSVNGLSINTIDAGTNRDSLAQSIRSSVGVGLLWSSPFGPIRFDYAWPINKQPWDRIQQFRFSGGTKF